MKKIYTMLTAVLLILFLASCGAAVPNEPSESSSAASVIAPQAQEESRVSDTNSSEKTQESSSETSEGQSESPALASQAPPTPEIPAEPQTPPSSAAPVTGDEAATEMNIQLTVNGETFSATLLDNSASRDLYSRLPLTLNFEDYNSIEKIADLSEELDTSDAPGGCDPTVGTLAYYAPWGNLSVFYEDFRQSDGLVPLGELESGIDVFAGQQGDFTVVVEKTG